MIYKILKITGICVAAVIALLLVAIAAFLIWRALGKAANERAMVINTPNGIDVLEKVSIGGIDQFIQIRGRDLKNPLLLCVHGGPGSTFLPYAYKFQTAWEKHFTVVQWEQRGAGLTYRLHGDDIADTMSLERMILDGIEVVVYLTKRYGKDRIILLGHSFGSILGTNMIKRRPDLFHAYIGVGQMVDKHEGWRIGHEYVLAHARAAGDTEALQKLDEIGPPPYGSTFAEFDAKVGIQQGLVSAYNGAIYGVTSEATFGKMVILAPRLPLGYILALMGGSRMSQKALFVDVEIKLDMKKLGKKFDVPIFFFLGRNDYVVPSTLAAGYFEEIEAPVKELVWFDRAAHAPFLTQPTAFLDALVEKVRPIAVKVATD
ncbi:MAG: alpha/beta hydrolase [Deltaproteobacteria bacterium]|nr:alpha/beta hydrolase [Deltaproteobacteria bacterium]